MYNRLKLPCKDLHPLRFGQLCVAGVPDVPFRPRSGPCKRVSFRGHAEYREYARFEHGEFIF